MKKEKQLLLSMFKVGCIGFGGGNALIPFIEKEVVNKYKLVTREEYNKFVVISNITPGALPVEMAVALGKTVAGIPGMLLAPICIMLPGVLATILLIALFSQFSGEAINQVRFASVGISVYIMYLLYQYNVKVVSEFKLASMKWKRIAVIMTVFFFTFGKEIYHIFGIEGTPIFDISTVNVLLLSFFVIFSSGKKMTKKRFVLDAGIVILYVLCVGKARVIHADWFLWLLRGAMLWLSVCGIRESLDGHKRVQVPSFRKLWKEELGLLLFLIICCIPAVLLMKETLLYVGKGYISSLISFGGGEAYLTVADSMFVENEITNSQLFSQLLPVANALPGSVLGKLLSGVGYYAGLNVTGKVSVGFCVALAGFATAISASGAVLCAVMYIYEMFENLAIFDLLRKCIRPIVGGLLLSTGLALYYELTKNMELCAVPAGKVAVGVFISLILISQCKKRLKIPDSILVIACGCVSLVLCNVL